MSSNCPVDDAFDPLAPEFRADPLAVLAALPADAPIFYAPVIGYYVVTRYADIEAIFLDHETFSAAPAQLPLVPLCPEALETLNEAGIRSQPSMVSLDPPEHTRLRGPTVRAFTPQRVARMEPRIRAIVAQLLDAIDPAAPFDLVASLTFPLPATVIFSFLGIPESDWQRLKEWCGHRASLAFGKPTPAEQLSNAENIAAYRNYLRAFVARHEAGSDDFTGALVDIHRKEPGTLTREEITAILYSLTFAGHETTNYLIGNLVRRLLEHPERWDAVVGDRTLVSAAVEETLRYDTSVPMWRRVTRRPVTLGGVELPQGAKLLLWLAASGRDRSVFPEPERFGLYRASEFKTLSFGKGIHYCLGAALGKLEARLALEALADRFPRLRLLEGREISFPPNLSFRGPQELWVHAT